MRGAGELKKTLSCLLVLVFAVSFLLVYNETYRNELDRMEKAGEGISKQFEIPNYANFAAPDEMYPILLEAAVDSKVNIFRTQIDYSVDDEAQIHKYVLLTNNTRLFDSFRLTTGKFLTAEDTQKSNSFLSTVDTGSQDQVGIIKSFGGHYLFEMKPLKTVYEHLPVAGEYFIEGTEERYNEFVDRVIQKIIANKLVGQGAVLTTEDFKGQSYNSGEMEIEEDFFTYIKYVIITIVIIMLIYYIFNESKRIGVMKMHGLSNLYLWYLVVGRFITILFLLSASASVLAALLIKDTTVSFIGSVVISQLISFVFVTFISLFAYIYISRIKVVDVIKNRKQTNVIFALNTLLKIGCSIFLILVILSIWGQYHELSIKQENLKSWERSKDYGVFYPVKVGNDSEDVEKGSPKTTVTEVTGLYPLLNRMGALYINAIAYEQQSLILNRESSGIRSISVNLNYLQEFPVYDIQNNPVGISEETSDFILLVPEKYRDKEKDILDYFKKIRMGRMEADGNLFKVVIPDSVRNQQLTIIWTANDQKIFSFNPDVFRLENNMIVDPIIQVITEKNSLVADKANMMTGGGGRDPLKVKLINRDSQQTVKALETEMKRLKLDDNLTTLISVDQYVIEQIYDLQKQRDQLLFLSIGLVAGLIVLVVQNLSVFFNKFQRRFIVRRLFGTDFIKTYKEYLWFLLATWVIQIGICFLINNGLATSVLEKAASVFAVATSIYQTIGSSEINVFAVGVGVIVIELMASVVALFVIERKNKVKVLKGGG
ncbi:bacteriocin-associated integral membrane protein possibly involved in immunity [Brevibacillus sp. BC25]|nr:bacteriocin-associated integral membrane protein possibly involved in immunity [Brevibacillus sp. BC25]